MSDHQTATSWPVVGHGRAVASLERAVATGDVGHAYLFSGPDQVGKRTLARTFAQALLCTAAANMRPCGECRACRLVMANHHPDFLTLDLAWQTKNLAKKEEAQSISVDAIRLMNSELSRRPHEGQWKVLLVPHVDDLTLAASNAFLKTLEEPPAFVVILLTTRDAELVLPTIRSRCQLLALNSLPAAQVEAVLTARYGVENEQARLLARVSGGRIGWAIISAGDTQIMEKRAGAFDTLQRALSSNRAERLLLAAPLGKSNDTGVLQMWASWWRDVMLVQNGAAGSITNVDQRAALELTAARYQPEQVRDFLRELQRLLRLSLDTNVNPQLLWEVLLLKLPKVLA